MLRPESRAGRLRAGQASIQAPTNHKTNNKRSMKLKSALTLALALACMASYGKKKSEGVFPDGTPIPEWFSDTAMVDVYKLVTNFVIT